MLIVSTDLPFGQKRGCAAESVEEVVTLSAHRSNAFGESYGVLISGGPFDQCLARAIFVVNDAGILKHVEYVKEVEHLDFDAALAAAGAQGRDHISVGAGRPATCFDILEISQANDMLKIRDFAPGRKEKFVEIL